MSRSFSNTNLITPSAARRSAYGSLLPVGFSSMAQKPTSVSSLSASATATDDRVGRHAVGRAERLVVLLDGARDRRVLALQLRVIAAHQPLQLGELADHLGDEVGLGEPRRALGLVRIGADDRRELPAPAPRCARRARLACRASRGRRCSSASRAGPPAAIFRSVSQKNFASDKPCPHDALVAGDDRRAAVRRLEVRDQDEAVRERAHLPRGEVEWRSRRVRAARCMTSPHSDAPPARSTSPQGEVAQHEAFLVRPDRRADDLGRDRQEGLVERAHQHHRPFDEAGDLLQQRLVLDELEAAREGEVLRLGADRSPCGGPGRARPSPARAPRRNRRSAAPGSAPAP